jgi:hypothetical protein
MENHTLQAPEEYPLDADDHLARPILSPAFVFEVPLNQVQLDRLPANGLRVLRAP